MIRKAALVLGIWSGCAIAANAQTYNYKLLDPQIKGLKGTLSGCTATDINDKGMLVGACDSSLGDGIGWSFDGSRYTQIDVRKAGLRTVLSQSGYSTRLRNRNRGTTIQAVNNLGWIAGWLSVNGPPSRFVSFVSLSGRVTAINVPTARITELGGINDLGDMVGDWQSSDGKYHGFLYSRQTDSYASFDAPNGDSGAMDINNAGQIVGCYNACSHGFLLDRGEFHAIDIANALVTQACGINDHQEIIGVYAADDTGEFASGFLLKNGQIVFIHVPGSVITVPYSINNQSQIVGYAIFQTGIDEFDNPIYDGRAFLATPQ